MAEEKKEAEAAAPSGPKKLLGLPMGQAILVLLNVVVVLGAVGFIGKVALTTKKPPITEEQVQKEITKDLKKTEEAVGIGFYLESYPETVVTLRGQQGGKPRFASVELSVVCGSEICLEQVKANKAKIEDIIQTVFSARTYTELKSLDVKFRVKHEILSKSNSLLKGTAATDVLITNYLLQ
jgi:flagellar basal body-associated protein FliL